MQISVIGHPLEVPISGLTGALHDQGGRVICFQTARGPWPGATVWHLTLRICKFVRIYENVIIFSAMVSFKAKFKTGNYCTRLNFSLNIPLFPFSSVEKLHLPDDHIMSTLLPATLGHLSPEHLRYFIHWWRLLDLELLASQRRGGVRDLWCHTGWQR